MSFWWDDLKFIAKSRLPQTVMFPKIEKVIRDRFLFFAFVVCLWWIEIVTFETTLVAEQCVFLFGIVREIRQTVFSFFRWWRWQIISDHLMTILAIIRDDDAAILDWRKENMKSDPFAIHHKIFFFCHFQNRVSFASTLELKGDYLSIFRQSRKHFCGKQCCQQSCLS